MGLKARPWAAGSRFPNLARINTVPREIAKAELLWRYLELLTLGMSHPAVGAAPENESAVHELEEKVRGLVEKVQEPGEEGDKAVASLVEIDPRYLACDAVIARIMAWRTWRLAGKVELRGDTERAKRRQKAWSERAERGEVALKQLSKSLNTIAGINRTFRNVRRFIREHDRARDQLRNAKAVLADWRRKHRTTRDIETMAERCAVEPSEMRRLADGESVEELVARRLGRLFPPFRSASAVRRMIGAARSLEQMWLDDVAY